MKTEEILKKITPAPVIEFTKENAIEIIKKCAKKGMCYMIGMVTPDVAKEFLTLEVYNRNRIPSAVKTYARYMSLGKWKLIPDPISFDTSANLIDGGNTLTSVIQSNIPSIFTICTGAPKDSVDALDQIAPRTVRDILGFQEHSYKDTATALHVAIVRSMITESPASLKVAIPKMELAEFIKVYFYTIDRVISIFGQSKCCSRMRNSSIMAPIVRAYEVYSENNDKIRRINKFIGCLTGDIRNQNREDDAAFRFRDWIMMEMSSTKTRPLKRVIYRKTEKALSLFIEGKSCIHITESNIECFPLNVSKHESLSTYLDNGKSMEKKHGNQRMTRKKNAKNELV